MEKLPEGHTGDTEILIENGIFKRAKLDEKWRFSLPANLRKYFQIQSGETCLFCFDTKSIHIVLDPQRKEDILTLDASESPAYQIKKVDLQWRILFWRDVLDIIKEKDEKGKVYHRYHNGVLDLLFTKDDVFQAESEMFENTRKMFWSPGSSRAHNIQTRTNWDVNTTFRWYDPFVFGPPK